jgi:hypothetical protein
MTLLAKDSALAMARPRRRRAPRWARRRRRVRAALAPAWRDADDSALCSRWLLQQPAGG